MRDERLIPLEEAVRKLTSAPVAAIDTTCVGCGVCVEVCQPHVLYFKGEMENLAKSPEPVTLHALGKQRCARCDRFFISSVPEEICPICEGDDADFASLLG